MTDERIQKIKSAVEAADHISPEKKTEFLAVLAKLKPAIAEVAQTSEEEAESISRFVEASAHKVASEKERPESVEKVLHKLKQTVEKFEASHPQLTRVRYRIFRGALRHGNLISGSERHVHAAQRQLQLRRNALCG